MKSYKNLYEKILEKENYDIAIRNVVKGKCGKSKKKRIKKFILENSENLYPEIVQYIRNYRHFKHRETPIYDGIRRKQRTIIVPSVKEQIMHHMIINVLKPAFMKSMYFHSYGSIPKRGSHKAARYIKKWLAKDVKGTKYYLKMDIRKYFDSIPHDILKTKLSKLFRDKQLLNLLFEIIDTTDKGIPLGFYTSQWFANFYLTELDHYIIEKLHAEHYVRYMDDMVVFGSNKRKLHKIRKAISDFLVSNLGLELKHNWQVCRIMYKGKGRDLDFMGFRFFREKTFVRKSIMLRMTRKARRLSKKKTISVHDARAMLSYLGWLNATNTYGMYKKWIKPYISFKRLKKIVRRYSKRKEVKICGEMSKTVTT